MVSWLFFFHSPHILCDEHTVPFTNRHQQCLFVCLCRSSGVYFSSEHSRSKSWIKSNSNANIPAVWLSLALSVSVWWSLQSIHPSVYQLEMTTSIRIGLCVCVHAGVLPLWRPGFMTPLKHTHTRKLYQIACNFYIFFYNIYIYCWWWCSFYICICDQIHKQCSQCTYTLLCNQTHCWVCVTAVRANFSFHHTNTHHYWLYIYVCVLIGVSKKTKATIKAITVVIYSNSSWLIWDV